MKNDLNSIRSFATSGHYASRIFQAENDLLNLVEEVEDLRDRERTFVKLLAKQIHMAHLFGPFEVTRAIEFKFNVGKIHNRYLLKGIMNHVILFHSNTPDVPVNGATDWIWHDLTDPIGTLEKILGHLNTDKDLKTFSGPTPIILSTESVDLLNAISNDIEKSYVV